MNSIPVLYYVGDASVDFGSFKRFWVENCDNWRNIEQLCLHCDLDRERWHFVQTKCILPKSVLRKKCGSLDWSLVYSEYESFTDDMVRELKDYVSFERLCRFGRKMTEQCIREFADRIDFHCLSGARELSFDFMDEFRDRLDWNKITEKKIYYGHLDDEFLTRFADCLDWHLLSRGSGLLDEQLEKYRDFLDWRELSVWRKWNATTVAKYCDLIDWNWISMCGNWYHPPCKLEQWRQEATIHVS